MERLQQDMEIIRQQQAKLKHQNQQAPAGRSSARVDSFLSVKVASNADALVDGAAGLRSNVPIVTKPPAPVANLKAEALAAELDAQTQENVKLKVGTLSMYCCLGHVCVCVKL